MEAALEKAFAASPDFSEDEILFMAEEGLGVDEILIKLKGANISERDRVRYRVKIEEIFEREFL